MPATDMTPVSPPENNVAEMADAIGAGDHLVHPRLARLDKLAAAMDTQWRLPLIGARVGWDTVLGLLPGIGDTLSSLISVYILKEGHALGVPFWVKLLMLWNIFVDWLIGLIPLFGDLFDLGWKANSRNVRLIRKYAKPDAQA